MTNDPKHQVLYALYSEYQKDVPDMRTITEGSLEMELPVFIASLLKLQNEGYIQGLVWTPPDEMRGNKIHAVKMDNVFLTRQGVEYVEKMAGIEASEKASAKILHLAKQVGAFGMSILKTFILSQLH